MISNSVKHEDIYTSWTNIRRNCSRTCSTTDTCDKCSYRPTEYYDTVVDVINAVFDVPDPIIEIKELPKAPLSFKPKIQKHYQKLHQPSGGWGFFKG